MSSRTLISQTPLRLFKCQPSTSLILRRRLATAAEDSHQKLSSPPNQAVRDALSRLPPRPRRLDHHSPRISTGDILTRSLDGGRSPIGSSYAKAKAAVHFPNVSLRLVRPSVTDRGDPFTAIFRCDLQLTKPDIFNYLRQIYGLGITSIRTAIYRGRYRRQLKSQVRGGVAVSRDSRRTFKKVWVGLDRPFFYPPRRSTKWLDEQYMYSDFYNSYSRSRLAASQKALTDRRQVMPSGMENKGERANVLRHLLDSKKEIQDELKAHVKQSLSESTKTPERAGPKSDQN